MNKIILIGASGFVGSAILNEALNRDIQVTAIVRDPSRITASNPNLTVVGADVSSPEAVAELCKGAEVVISACNPGKVSEDTGNTPPTIYPAILNGLKEAGVKRLLIVGGAGTLFVSPGVRLVDSGAIPAAILPWVKPFGEFYINILQHERNIDWVFFSPAANFSTGNRTGKFRLGKDDLIVDSEGNSAISVQDYAMAMIDEFENPKHHQERFTIGY